MNFPKQDDARSLLSRRRLLGSMLIAGGAFGMPAMAQEAPRKGGTLTVCYPSAVDALDPHRTISGPGQQLAVSVFESLTMLDEHGQPQPRLATAWAPEKDGTEWVFQLRQGVRFHHGTEFTSKDVAATIERVQDPKLALLGRGAFGPIKEVRAEGPYAVRLVMTQAVAEVPALVANRYARIVAADRMDTLATAPSGTGPFMFVAFQPGVSVTTKRNPNYWMPDLPYLDGMRLVSISQSIAQQAALRSGTVDVLEFLSADSYLTLKATPHVNAYSITVSQYYTLMTQANLAPFDNIHVREAFKYILDRPMLMASAVLGQGTVANDVPLGADNAYYTPLPQYTQDLPKARALLNTAGVQNLSLELYTSSERQPSPKIAVAFKEAAAKIGINVAIRDVPFSEYLANVARKKPLYTSQWNERVTLYEALYQIYRSGSPFNYSGVEQAPGLDAKLDQMIAELDFAKRKALAADAMASIHQYGDRIIPFFMNYMCATRAVVKGYVPPRFGTAELRGVWLQA